MKPIKFPGYNIVMAEDQPQYQPLPIYMDGDSTEGRCISCWQLSLWDHIKLLLNGGRLYISQLTFGNGFSPQLPTVDNPLNEFRGR